MGEADGSGRVDPSPRAKRGKVFKADNLGLYLLVQAKIFGYWRVESDSAFAEAVPCRLR